MTGHQNSFVRGCVGLMAAYCIAAALLYGIAGEQFHWKPCEQRISVSDSTDGAEPLYGTHILEQSFRLDGDRIDAVSFKSCTYGRENYGTLTAQLTDGETGEVLCAQSFDMERLPDNEFVPLSLAGPIPIQQGNQYTLRLFGTAVSQTQAASAVYHRQAALPDGTLSYDGRELPGALCLEIVQSDQLWLGPHYMQAASVLGVLLAGYLYWLWREKRLGRRNLLLNALDNAKRYHFLLKQLISRDFKTKYKRSVLGVLWSFLNPLLTMTVQYIIFSTVFHNDIQNFPAYLLIGVVFFNFFSEACGMGLMSIVGNAPLLTKVYIPKYIFPVSRVLSAFVNFALALLPLSLVLLVTGQRITKAVLLLPFSLTCVLLFGMGMALLLSSLMVYFRDTQFLWNVVSVLWMYATPIFYPETIIPPTFTMVYKMNPLYHFIRFTRLILLDGVSPEPKAYLFCILSAVVPLLLGIEVFKRSQDGFVLNI